jgi:parvulin-like peptidyl-prolyl isomerase
MKNQMIFLIVLLLTPLLPTGCGDSRNTDPVVSFTGGELMAEDLAAHHELIRKKPRFSKNPDQLTPEFVFEHALNMEMIIARGLDEKLHLDPRIRARIHDFMAELFLQILTPSLVPEIDKADFTEEELRRYFEDNRDSYQEPARYHVRMIRAGDEKEARQVMDKIRSGKLTFEQAAGDYSLDPKTRDAGGNTGARALSRFRESWRPVVAALEPEQVSGPFEIDGHYHILRLDSRTDPVPYAFEDRETYVRNDLLYARYRDEWTKTYDELKKQFQVEVNEQQLAAFLDQGPVTGDLSGLETRTP